jgi:CheY-like chemotaxis protein
VDASLKEGREVVQGDERLDRQRALRILVVEDEGLVAMLLEDMLEELGHQVVGPAATLKRALELAREEAVDIAVVDLNLNGQDASPVAAVLVERKIPFACATGYGELPEPLRGSPILAKPYDFDALKSVISQLSAPGGR